MLTQSGPIGGKMFGSRLIVTVLALTFSLSINNSLNAAEKTTAPIDGVLLSDNLLSSGYLHSRAIIETLNSSAGANLTLRPVSDSVHRTLLLTDETADFCICDMESYFAQEGLLEFNEPTLGPQPLRLVLSAASDFKLGLIIAKDSKAKEISDLSEKRIPWIRNADQLNAHMTAFLAFAGLSWNDVVKLTYPGYKEALSGFKRNQIDALLIEANQEASLDLAGGKRSFFHADFSSKKHINWRRMKTMFPYLQPATSGSWNGVTHPYPVLITTESQTVDQVYNLTKAMSENLETISTRLPGAESWHANWQNLTWVFPFHEGAIKYFKEIGIWTDNAQSHQDQLIHRQQQLRSAFDAYKGKNPDEKTFKSGWQQIRDATLSQINH